LEIERAILEHEARIRMRMRMRMRMMRIIRMIIMAEPPFQQAPDFSRALLCSALSSPGFTISLIDDQGNLPLLWCRYEVSLRPANDGGSIGNQNTCLYK
jgi:hypothetical protein